MDLFSCHGNSIKQSNVREANFRHELEREAISNVANSIRDHSSRVLYDDERALKRVMLSDISPANRKRTTGTNRNIATPDDIADGLHINPRSLHNRSYLPSHVQNHLVYSCIDWKWRGKPGKEFDLCLHEMVHDEMNREKSSGKKKARSIDLQLLANVL